jgi:hypothetical protein
MDKEQIESRKKVLEASRDQLIANLNIINGAIQDCDFWLAQLEQLETKENPAIKKQIIKRLDALAQKGSAA